MCSKGTAAFPCFKRILVVNSALGFGVPPGIRGGSVGDEPKSCENVKAGKSVQGAAAKKRRPEAPQGGVPEGQPGRSPLSPFGRRPGARWPSQKRRKGVYVRRSKLLRLRPALTAMRMSAPRPPVARVWWFGSARGPQGSARAAGPRASIPAWSGVLAQNARGRQLKR